MKTLLQLYKVNPIVSLVVNCIGFFIWATTLILMMVILTVAFAG
jgi:hypothetical protein